MPQLSREIRRQRSIFDNSVCLQLAFTKLGDRRTISSSTVQVGEGVEPSWIGVSKRLYESKALKDMATLDSEIKAYISARSVPSDFLKGVFIVNLLIVEDVDKTLLTYQTKREDYVRKFADEYPAIIEAARLSLGEKFDPSDYPSLSQAVAAFTMDWRFLAFATPGNLAVASADLLEREELKMREKMLEISDSVSALLTEQMAGLVESMVEKLKPGVQGEDGKLKKPIFRDSLVGNFREFMDNFKYRNITDNEDLDNMVTKCRDLLAGVAPQDLRDQDSLRESIRRGFETIKTELSEMVIEKPTRKVNVRD